MEHEVRLPTHQQRAKGQDDGSLNKLPQIMDIADTVHIANIADITDIVDAANIVDVADIVDIANIVDIHAVPQHSTAQP